LRRPNGDKHVLDHRFAGDYAAIEQTFDDTPRRRRRRGPVSASTSAPAGLESSGAVAPVGGYVCLRAQSEPDVSGRDARRQGLAGGPVAQSGEDEVGNERIAAGAELVGDGALELATTQEPATRCSAQ
jgi:hypothetical protein